MVALVLTLASGWWEGEAGAHLRRAAEVGKRNKEAIASHEHGESYRQSKRGRRVAACRLHSHYGRSGVAGTEKHARRRQDGFGSSLHLDFWMQAVDVTRMCR